MSNHENIIIRFAEPNDLDGILSLCQAHAEFEKSEYNFEGKKEGLSKNLFQEHPTLYCLVVQKDNELVGYATYMPQFSTWDATFYLYMDCLFLTDGSRGFGIGEQLMDLIKKESVRLGCTHIQWQTPTFNIRAIKFYNRIGATSKDKGRFFLSLM